MPDSYAEIRPFKKLIIEELCYKQNWGTYIVSKGLEMTRLEVKAILYEIQKENENET